MADTHMEKSAIWDALLISEPTVFSRVVLRMGKVPTAKITEFETSFDAVPVATADGQIVWADVRIEYLVPSGLRPCVTIRVPVPWEESDTIEERKSKALRCARKLIDHACRTVGTPEPVEEPDEEAATGILEGLSQELGLSTPKTQ